MTQVFFEASVQCADHKNMTTIFQTGTLQWAEEGYLHKSQSKSKGFLHVLVPSCPWFPTHARASRWSHHVFFLVFPPVFANSSLAVFKVDPRKPNDGSVRDLFLFPKNIRLCVIASNRPAVLRDCTSLQLWKLGCWPIAGSLSSQTYLLSRSLHQKSSSYSSCSAHPAGLPPGIQLRCCFEVK